MQIYFFQLKKPENR